LGGISGDLSNIQLAGMDSNQLYSVLKTIPGVIDKVCALFATTLNVAICETHDGRGAMLNFLHVILDVRHAFCTLSSST
jgi:hypothetical protein